MKLFATRVWGFDPVSHPVASFGSEGICNNLIKASKPGDRLVFVGTKDEPTMESERGAILGYIEFGRDVVNTLDVIDEDSRDTWAYDDKGNFKFPRALMITRAWKIDLVPLPDLVETIGRQLERLATSYAVKLADPEAAAVLALPNREVSLSESPRLLALRSRNNNLGFGGRSIGPVPSDKPGGGSTTLGNEAFTYCMRFGKRNCFKIGWSKDPKARLVEINKHVPSELLEEEWALVLTHPWAEENGAYQMEQAMLDSLSHLPTHGERVLVSENQMMKSWNDYLASGSVP